MTHEQHAPRPRHNLPCLFGVSVVCLILLGGCQTAEQATDDYLFGREFFVVAAREGGDERLLLRPERSVVSIGRNGIGWRSVHDAYPTTYAVCNMAGSDMTVEGDRLVVVDDYSTTQQACGTTVMQQEEWLAEFLTSDPTWESEGEKVVLTSGDMAVELEEASPTDLPSPP